MPNNLNMVVFMDALVEGGFSERQAKALTSAMLQLIESQLVTRDYLDMRLSEVCMEMAAMKADLLQWIVGLVVVQSGVTAVLFKLLH